MTIEPLQTHVLIQIIKMQNEEKQGDIYLPQIDYRQREYGKILALGKSTDPELKIGDTVCFPVGVGTFIDHEIDGQPTKCLLMEFAHIKYILENDDEQPKKKNKKC